MFKLCGHWWQQCRSFVAVPLACSCLAQYSSTFCGIASLHFVVWIIGSQLLARVLAVVGAVRWLTVLDVKSRRLDVTHVSRYDATMGCLSVTWCAQFSCDLWDPSFALLTEVMQRMPFAS